MFFFTQTLTAASSHLPMEIDPIEIRIGNYFEHNHQVIDLSLDHMARLKELLPELKPIPITGQRLARLMFTYIGNPDSEQRYYQKFTAGIYFNLYVKRSGKLVLYINEDIRLPDIQYIHQLQNVYYDLTGDVLVRKEPGKEVNPSAPKPMISGFAPRKSGPGKYRDKK